MKIVFFALLLVAPAFAQDHDHYERERIRIQQEDQRREIERIQRQQAEQQRQIDEQNRRLEQMRRSQPNPGTLGGSLGRGLGTTGR